MEFFYPLFSAISRVWRIEQLIKTSEQWLFLPVYHTISDKPLPHLMHLYPIKTVAQFETDIKVMLRHFEPISLAEIQEHLTHKKTIHRPVFHPTFDDGMRDNIRLIAPILKQKNVAATFFINNDFVDNQRLFYRHKVSLLIDTLETKNFNNYNSTLALVKEILLEAQLFSLNIKKSLLSLNATQEKTIDDVAKALSVSFKDYLATEQPYMTSEEIRQLQADGFTIGGHSVSHPNFGDISLSEQLTQTQQSLDFVQTHFPESLKTFAFPYSSDMIRAEYFHQMAEKMDISFGTSGLKIDTFANHLHRFPMEGTPFSTETLVRSAYFYFLLKIKMRKERLIR